MARFLGLSLPFLVILSMLSMERILERYDRHSFSSGDVVEVDAEAQGCLSSEYLKLKSKVEALQKNQRQFLGEGIENMGSKELQSLEQQLDSALRQIRSRKNQLLFGSVSELQRKERALLEENNKLKKQIKENGLTLSLCERHNHVEGSPTTPPLEAVPTQHVSGTSQSSGIEVEEEGVTVQARPRTLIPPWMLSHINE